MTFDNNVPIYIQVIDNIKKDIIKGKLAYGERLPSTRELAIKYEINPNTAGRVYKELEAEEICYTKRGLGTFITEDKNKIATVRNKIAKSLVNNFIIGMKDLGYSEEELIQIIKINYEECMNNGSMSKS